MLFRSIRKAVGDILSILRPDETAPFPGKGRRQSRERDKVIRDLQALGASDLERLIQTLEEEMHQAASDLHFEQAARLRDEIKRLRATELAVTDDPTAKHIAAAPSGGPRGRQASSRADAPSAAKRRMGRDTGPSSKVHKPSLDEMGIEIGRAHV